MCRRRVRSGSFRWERSMPRQRTGTVAYVEATAATPGHYKARVTCADGSRPWIHLEPAERSAKAEARARKQAGELASRVRLLGVVAVEPRPTGTLKDGATVAAWFESWIAHRETKGLTSTRDDRGRFKLHIEPHIGHLPMPSVTRDDIQRLVLALDTKIQAGELGWKTATNVWGVVTKMFKDSVASKLPALQVRRDNPCADVEGPDRGGAKSKAFLYPSELLTFAEAEAVPLEWRRLVVLAVYLGARTGELEALEWSDIDLDHGKINIHRSMDRVRGVLKSTKSDNPRTFTMEPTLLPLLRSMHAAAGGSGRVVQGMPSYGVASQFREWLRVAGVDRPELFASDATRLNIRFHDLRATSITWQVIRGDNTHLVMGRVGHEHYETMRKYLRQAEALRDGFGDCFPTLPAGLSIVPPNRPKGPKSLKSLRPQRDSNPLISLGKSHYSGGLGSIEDRAIGANPNDTDAKCAEPGGPDDSQDDSNTDPRGVTETALARALELAAVASRWDVVLKLATELEARRTSKATPGALVQLAKHRAGGES